MSRQDFKPDQARRLASAFDATGAEYLFIGKSGAVLLGFPGITQDLDVFANRSAENGRRIVTALRDLDFELGPELVDALITGKDFVQIKGGPFDVDIIFAPDGIPDFSVATGRALLVDGFRIANLRDIIASKRASGREKDLLDLEYLERFRQEFEKLHPVPLRSAADIVADRSAKP